MDGAGLGSCTKWNAESRRLTQFIPVQYQLGSEPASDSQHRAVTHGHRSLSHARHALHFLSPVTTQPHGRYLSGQFIDEDTEVRVRLFVQGHTDGRCRSGNARRPYRSDVHYFSLSPPCSSHHPSPIHLQMETQLWRLVPPNPQNIAISCGTLLHPRHVVIGSEDLGQAQRSPGWLKSQLYSLLAVWPWVSH